ncbi:hypothetical protein N9980_01235 [bacterium]|nr:hypothetical protein [bacterium]
MGTPAELEGLLELNTIGASKRRITVEANITKRAERNGCSEEMVAGGFRDTTV